eukprot:4247974-Pyramimonas_sp.AAC.1
MYANCFRTAKSLTTNIGQRRSSNGWRQLAKLTRSARSTSFLTSLGRGGDLAPVAPNWVAANAEEAIA